MLYKQVVIYSGPTQICDECIPENKKRWTIYLGQSKSMNRVAAETENNKGKFPATKMKLCIAGKKCHSGFRPDVGSTPSDDRVVADLSYNRGDICRPTSPPGVPVPADVNEAVVAGILLHLCRRLLAHLPSGGTGRRMLIQKQQSISFPW